MPNYKLLVFSNPASGREEEYNRWYTDIHLGEVVASPGFTGARRFRLVPGDGPRPSHSYLAIYDLETDDVQDTLGGMTDRAANGQMQMSDAIDPEVILHIYEELPGGTAAK